MKRGEKLYPVKFVPFESSCKFAVMTAQMAHEAWNKGDYAHALELYVGAASDLRSALETAEKYLERTFRPAAAEAAREEEQEREG